MLVVTDALYGDHLRGIGHPESPDRVEVVTALLRERGLLESTLAARDASDEELVRVHSQGYVDLVKREISRAQSAQYLSTGDVVVDPRSLDVARRAAGGAIVAIETAAERQEPVFALVRPPGHHAERRRGMGFCLFNNAAIAARAYQAMHGGRVMIVDFDYHHGNGTQDVSGDGLSYLSTHASPAYPGTGFDIEIGDDAVVNVPLPASGIATEAFVAVWDRLLATLASHIRPDAIVVSAGFDYVAGDPVGDLGVDVAAASSLAHALNAVVQEYASGRIAYVLEGGYAIPELAESIARILAVEQTTTKSDAEAASIPASIAQRLDAAAAASRA